MKRQSNNPSSQSLSLDETRLIQVALYFPEEFQTRDVETPHEPGKLNSRCHEISAILNHINVDSDTIIAAILLIGLEDHKFDQVTMESRFPSSICNLVVQSYALIQQENNWLEMLKGDLDEKGGSSHHMMLLNMMKDARVIFILLAYQVLKMHELVNKPEIEQLKVAEETKTVFVPLANRLGIGQLKWELEDLAFRYMQPNDYHLIAKSLEERRVDRESYMESIVSQLQHTLDDIGLDCDVQGRAKHIFSIWKKMQQKDLAFSDLYDVRAVRVLVDDLDTCYTVLSIVHGLWQFIPSEYDDYVAAPKSNNYQSLHTAVLGPDNKTVEIQIRTYAMHDHAELGVAAHWRYKEGGKRDSELEQQLESLREILSQRSPVTIKKIKTPRIYVLSPKGHVVELPFGATPLDFAYHIHTEVGHKCRGAKVNGKIISLTTPLLNGQTVEVITVKDGKPSRDWLVSHLGYLKSSRAKSKVKAWFKREFREEHISAGKLLLTKQVSILPTITALKSLAATFNMHHVDDLYAAIGRGELGVNQVLNSLKIPESDISEKKFLLHERSYHHHKSDIIIKGVDGLMTNLARCCKPLPGDQVTGFITQGKGVTIHRSDCSNLLALKEQHVERLIEVSWGASEDQTYEVDVEIIALDRSGLLRDVMSVMSGKTRQSINVNAVNTYTDKKIHEARMRLTLEINNPEQLIMVLAKLSNLRGVLEATRVK